MAEKQDKENPPGENKDQLTIGNLEPLENPTLYDSTPKYTPIESIRELVTGKGLSCPQAGKILGISAQAVWERCQTHGIMTKNQLNMYKSQRADILASKGQQIIKSLDEAAIKSIPAGSRATAFAILYDKERLERGKATSNIEVHELSREQKELTVKRDRLLSELDDLAGSEI